MKRPTSIPVIGCVYIGCGSVLVLGSLFLLVMSALMRLPNAGAAESGLASNFLHNFSLEACVPLCPAAILIFAGAAFFGRRPWSRALMEVIAWLGLVLLVGFSISTLTGMNSLMASGPEAFSGSTAGGLTTDYFIGTLWMMLVIDAVLGLPLIVIIFILRSRAVREALAGRQA